MFLISNHGCIPKLGSISSKQTVVGLRKVVGANKAHKGDHESNKAYMRVL